MKSLLATFIALLALLTAYSATNIATSNGNWNTSSTWSLNRVPANNDLVVIPIGRTVYFQNTPYSKSDVVSRPTLNIDIYGTLDFSNSGNDKLYLDQGSSIEIFILGSISTTSASSEIIAIYDGVDDNTVWTGSPSVLYGPKSATGTTNGFQSALLPVKLERFEVTQLDKANVVLEWTTSEEINSDYFEPQQYDNANGEWKSLGRVDAAGDFSGQKHYSFRATLKKGKNQFRLKQVDFDGHFTYTAIRQLHGNNEARISYSSETRSLVVTKSDFSGRQTILSVYGLQGQLVFTASVSGNQQSIPINFAGRGIYVAVLSDGLSTSASRIVL